MSEEQKHDITPEEKARILMDRLMQGFNGIAFNRHIGLGITHISESAVTARFSMQPELIGNPAFQILHGGVIAAALDSVGGAMGSAAAYVKMKGLPREEKMLRMARFGTIDMRVDYLQPGRGEWFEASGKVLRVGKKVCVTQMQLVNDSGELIAMGTGTYLY